MVDRYEKQAHHEKFQGKYQAMVVCCILGVGTVISWNSMLTIEDYYYHVFPDYHPSRVLTVVYQPFALGTIMIFLDLATKGHGGIVSYIGLCAIVALFGLADATVRGGMIGDLSLMCPELIQSFMAGLAIAGALTSAIRLITKAAFEKSHDGLRKRAIIFLAIATFIELLCVILYAYVFPKLPTVKYYRSKAASEGSKTVLADLVAAGIQKQSESTDDDSKNQRLSNKELLRQNIDYAVNLFLLYVLTLSIVPGFLYENTGQHGLGTWYALVLVAMYNCWDLVGRYTPLVKWLKIENRKGLTVAVLLRFFLIPAFYFTAKYGDQGWMIMLISILGLTNGHLSVCILTRAPKGYKGPEQNALGNLLVTFLLGGVFAGVALDWLWLIGKKNVF
ncbi:equilibrative nucleotide transporter 3-like [Arabidopsis lyrata subsp. lyrata]|uniref:equilibrative nucleotide transporter 3-like n=1 Tax=Arabidopsis lyrata subsp. lyrata TaxID=81972 RepID=UPI000A29A8CC|nr:equilibrative nucleotide transporter 3-like [Arabidopsis lyrata subsp. lyrata]|eukprot:XP_020877203.1 equilibrative nucleotide transporter 3-like [Arabidopsis lyrata subsp. lyrata]